MSSAASKPLTQRLPSPHPQVLDVASQRQFKFRAPVHPGEKVTVAIPFTAPNEPQTFRHEFMLLSGGRNFGPSLWVELVAVQAGSGATQGQRSEKERRSARSAASGQRQPQKQALAFEVGPMCHGGERGLC